MSHALRPAVVIYAKDIDRVALFYALVFELTETARADDYVSLSAPSYAITVVRIRAQLASQIDISTPPQRRENVAVKLVLPVDSLERAREKVAKLGGAIGAVEKQWQFDGAIRCDGNDPEGNVIQFAEAVSPSRA
ncbi:MAG: hypothetical protein IKE66_12790 [Hyphomicrobium sp.]|nr:hypothetical protein [Hyphomicrobium sp.]